MKPQRTEHAHVSSLLFLALVLVVVLVSGCAVAERPSAGIAWDAAAGHIGESTTVEGRVVGTHYASSSNGSPTFLNLGLDYPDPDRLQVVIFGDSRGAFPGAPEDMYAGKTIAVKGTIELYKGVAEIIVDSPDDISVVD